MTEGKVHTEEFNLDGAAVISKIKEILNEGNIRRVTLKTVDEKVLIDIPLTIGVVGVLLAPQLAAIGAVAALVTSCKLVIEKDD
jgi:hypothetical protein